jgi:predicted transposase YbfD/YdcC
VALRWAGAGIGQYREGLHHAYVHSQQKIHEWTSFLHLINQISSNAIALMEPSIRNNWSKFAGVGMVERHWKIKTRQHWVLDVTFREGKCRVRAGYALRKL